MVPDSSKNAKSLAGQVNFASWQCTFTQHFRCPDFFTKNISTGTTNLLAWFKPRDNFILQKPQISLKGSHL